MTTFEFYQLDKMLISLNTHTLSAFDLKIVSDFYGISQGLRASSYFCFDEFYVAEGDDPVTNLHLAFQAESIEQVQAFYEAGLKAGGKDNGAPGYREYHDNYYAAFLIDPDGNNIEAVCDVGTERSSESVVISREDGRDD